jgi:S1-C subfamily serine protease
LNNERVNHAFDIITRLRMMEPGDTATLTVVRGEETLEIPVQF